MSILAAGEDRWKRALTVFLAASATLVIALAIERLFNVGILGAFLIDNRYLYLILTLVLPSTFIIYPLARDSRIARALDFALAIACFLVFAYFTENAEEIVAFAWEFAPPTTAVWVAVAGWLLVIEATRRAGGIAVTAVVIVLSLYPVYAASLPGPIAGFSQPFDLTISYHMMSMESVLGIPLRAFAELVIGFIVFGVVLQHTGAGAFFNSIALALVGGVRGGAAKVSILASGGMGSMSGSVVSNIITTGAVTIPAMIDTGFSRRHAGAVESCASTGAVLMPPVMGATAFVMASFLNIPYWHVAVAAAVPSVLFYFALFVQIDCYAAYHKLAGMRRDQLPKLGETLRSGWHYLLGLAILIAIMVQPGWEKIAPFYATLVLLVLDLAIRRGRVSLWGYVELLANIMRTIVALVALVAGVGLIVGGMVVAGLAGTLANDLVFVAGNATIMLLLMGAVTSFIFGMGMTVTASYIFLAIVLAPALVRAGLDPLAVHLFIMYWGMLSFITPPVAIGSFVAANLAKASPIAVGLESMRFGAVMYFLPFIFVLNPALILHGSLTEIGLAIGCAVGGIFFIASGLQGWLAGVGELGSGVLGFLSRLLVIVLGLSLAFASTPTLTTSVAIGLAVACGMAAVGCVALSRRMRAA